MMNIALFPCIVSVSLAQSIEDDSPVGGDVKNVAQQVRLRLECPSTCEDATWQVEGEIVRAIDLAWRYRAEDVDEEPLLGAPADHGDLVASLPSEDACSVSFYWRERELDEPSPRTVRATSADGTCSAERTFTVERNATDPVRQFDDWWTDDKDEFIFVQHRASHMANMCCEEDYRGALFFSYHKGFVERYAQFREDFGYPALREWDPGTEYPDVIDGFDVTHEGRATSAPEPEPDYAAYLEARGAPVTMSKPPWLTVDGLGGASVHSLGEGREGLVNCLEPDRTWSSLADVEDLDELSCLLTQPWHRGVHITVGGDMATLDSPADPIFYGWHLYLQQIVEEWASVRAAEHPPEVALVHPPPGGPIAGGSEAEEDFTALVEVWLTAPVTGMTADMLTVNGSPATSVEGSGQGPYYFSGYAVPPEGIATISLAGGATNDRGEALAEYTWEIEVASCTEDRDGDGWLDRYCWPYADRWDNCPDDYNPDQEDSDKDMWMGDACDPCPDAPLSVFVGHMVEPEEESAACEAGVLRLADSLIYAPTYTRVRESDGTATIQVERQLGRSGAVEVSYRLVAMPGGALGEAQPGTDFQPTEGTLRFEDGDDGPVELTVELVDDDVAEGTEVLGVEFGVVTGGAIFGGIPFAVVIIEDDPGDGAADTGLDSGIDPGGGPADAEALGYLAPGTGCGCATPGRAGKVCFASGLSLALGALASRRRRL
jgi:hypothetical protein